MTIEEENIFLQYWEKNRQAQNTALSKISRGLPMAIIFAVPIILILIVVNLFFSNWYMKISQTSPSMLLTAVVAMCIIIIFYAFLECNINGKQTNSCIKK